MLSFVQQQPYVFALAIVVLTALLTFLYDKTLERDPAHHSRTFFKTLAAGVAAGLSLTWLTSPRSELLATEPFDAVGNGGGM